MPKQSLEIATAPTTVIPSLPAPAVADRAGRIAHYHRLSAEAGRVSIMAALAAGLELHAAKAEVEHGMFTAWVKANCPGVTQRTAQRYMQLAEGLLGAALGPEGGGEAGEDGGGWLPELLAAPEPELLAALAESAAAADARTLTELYAELGIVRPYKSNIGGARPGAGRPRKDAAAQPLSMVADPDANAAECLGYLGRLYDWAIARDGWGYLSDKDLLTARATLKDIAKRADAIVAARRRATR